MTVSILGRVGQSDRSVIQALIPLLQDPDPGVRSVMLLGKQGKPAQSSIPHLSQILKYPNSEVSRDEIIAVLKKLRS